MDSDKSHLARAALPFAAATVFTLVLFALTAWFDTIGGLAGLWQHKLLELPLVLYLYWLFAELARGHRWRWALAGIPVLTGYILFDGYFLLFRRVFRLTEIDELPELLDILPLPASAGLVVAAIAIFVTLAFSLRHILWGRLALASIPLIALIAGITLMPGRFLQALTSIAHGTVEWSDAEHVRRNGRLTSILYQEARRRRSIEQISSHYNADEYPRRFRHALDTLHASGNQRNVHLVVYEGFLDPLRIERLNLDRDPMHPKLRKLLREGQGELSVSPVFGGYTAQAEFEVLCGVPAIQRLGTIEFNSFNGARVHCMPDIFRELGYRTIASNGYKPNFFNAAVAYRGTGFEEIYFPHEYTPNSGSYFSTGDVSKEKYMFDRTLFEQNLAFVGRHIREGDGRPLFNYVLTIYGHFPFRLDTEKRPWVTHALNTKPVDKELMVIINQVYYRSEALAWYLQQLYRLDPNAVVLIVADHLPPLKNRRAAYSRLRYLGDRKDAANLTLLAVYDRGSPVEIGVLPQHGLPGLLFNLLSGGHWCKGEACKRSPQTLEADYLQLMAHAVDAGS